MDIRLPLAPRELEIVREIRNELVSGAFTIRSYSSSSAWKTTPPCLPELIREEIKARSGLEAHLQAVRGLEFRLQPVRIPRLHRDPTA